MSGPITPTPPTGAQGIAPKGQVVQIVSLPEGLQNNARAIRIEGEVVQQNKDGSVRIRTERGDVDIQVRGRQPQVGVKVEVEIPASHPPRNATLRPAPIPVPAMPLPQTPPPTTNIPLPQTPVVQQPTQQQPATQPAPTNQAPVDPNAPVVTKPLPPSPATQAPVQTAPPISAVPVPTTLPPVTTGQVVQIVPLSAETPDAALPTNLATLAIDKATAQATQAAQKVQTGLIGNLIQAVKSVLPATSSIAAQPVGISIPAQASTPQTVVPPSLSIQQPLVLTAKIISIVSPLDQRIFVPQAQQAQIIVPQTATQTGTPQISAQPLTVTVTEMTVHNKPVISIPMNNNGAVQNFVLQASAANTPLGTQITLMPQITAAPLVTNATASNALQVAAQPATITTAQVTTMPPAWRALLPLMQPLPIWPAMDDVFQTFYQATPQAAQILGRIIPSPANPQSFGPAVMLFAAALKSGDIQGWLGDKKLEMIQKLGKDGLLSRLSGDAATLSQNADAAATDWKSYPIPLLYQNEISKIVFHVRREPDEENQQNENGTTRFVMDVSLPRMGEVQLDALVRGNRVDLTVRTELPISLPMQDAMRTAYATALDNTMIYGDIGFQSDVRNFISVLGRETALASA